MPGADKDVSLNFVIRAIDRATAPMRKVANAARSLSERLGGPAFAKGIQTSMGAVRDVVGGLRSGFVRLAGAVGLSTAAVKLTINELDNLAKTADRIGLSVDALAELRFAAGQTGVEANKLDEAMESFSRRLGKARGGAGELAEFLKKVSPTLLRQLKAAKGNEEALNLMADAMAKVEDPAKRAALASATFGDAGQKLDILLKGGRDPIAKLRKEYSELAGSQETAARKAEEINDAVARIGAVFQGVKAAMVEGLAPAFLELAETAKNWLSANRAAIAEFVADFGKKLPARVKTFIGALDKLRKSLEPVIDAMGGLRHIAIAAAVVIGVKLVLALKALGIAMLATPIGLVITAISALIVAGYALIKNWEIVKAFFLRVGNVIADAVVKAWQPVQGFFEELWDAIVAAFEAAGRAIDRVVDRIMAVVDRVKDSVLAVRDAVSNAFSAVGGAIGDAVGSVRDAASAVGGVFSGDDDDESSAVRSVQSVPLASQLNRSTIEVVFRNTPPGTQVEGEGDDSLDLDVGYQLGATV